MAEAYDERSQERWVTEPAKRPGRTAFARDRARILHSAALRRLAAKTQVVVPGEHDFPRTRLTHSIEVGQVGRELGQALGCDPDLVEAACLAHDLGHPPFGHTGEEALDEAAKTCGGFEGNAQTLRILTRLEAKTFGSHNGPLAGRSVGLNLTRAALDAATKYPWTADARTRKYGVYADDLAAFEWLRDGAPERQPCFEAQVMDWADDIAYSVHDLEDALVSEHLRLDQLSDASERAAVATLAVERYVPGAEPDAVVAALARLAEQPWWPTGYDGSLRGLAGLKNLTSQLIGRFCASAERATRQAYGAAALTRYAARLEVPLETRLECAALKAVAAAYVMERAEAEATRERQRAVVRELADALVAAAPDSLGPLHRTAWEAADDDAGRLRAVVDLVASLTDPSATALHARLTGRRGRGATS